MQNNYSNFTKLARTAAIAFIASVGTMNAQTKTAQSIMIDTSSIASTYAIAGTETYRFNIETAAGYFTNLWDGNAPVIAMKGPGTTSSAEALANLPTAPAPQASVVVGNGPGGNIGKDGLVGANRCNFLNGGVLVGTSYTQDVKVELGTGGGKRTYTYTFTYIVAPTQTVLPFTAWDLEGSSGGAGNSVSLDVVAMIAGESVSVSKNLGTKYSFSLLQNDGLTVRIQNVGVSLDGGAADFSGTLTYFDRGNTPTLNFYYTGNAGFNGTVQGSLLNGDAEQILNGQIGSDTFAGNNNGGADGKALAEVMLSGLSLNLTPGAHSITITAVVKDNVGAYVTTVGVTKSVEVITPGCGSSSN